MPEKYKVRDPDGIYFVTWNNKRTRCKRAPASEEESKENRKKHREEDIKSGKVTIYTNVPIGES